MAKPARVRLTTGEAIADPVIHRGGHVSVMEPPENRHEAWDRLLAGALSSIPILGGPAGTGYQLVMEGPYNKRLHAWRLQITARRLLYRRVARGVMASSDRVPEIRAVTAVGNARK